MNWLRGIIQNSRRLYCSVKNHRIYGDRSNIYLLFNHIWFIRSQERFRIMIEFV